MICNIYILHINGDKLLCFYTNVAFENIGFRAFFPSIFFCMNAVILFKTWNVPLRTRISIWRHRSNVPSRHSKFKGCSSSCFLIVSRTLSIISYNLDVFAKVGLSFDNYCRWGPSIIKQNGTCHRNRNTYWITGTIHIYFAAFLPWSLLFQFEIKIHHDESVFPLQTFQGIFESNTSR